MWQLVREGIADWQIFDKVAPKLDLIRKLSVDDARIKKDLGLNVSIDRVYALSQDFVAIVKDVLAGDEFNEQKAEIGRRVLESLEKRKKNA